MRQLLDWQREAGDPGEFLDSLRYEMASSEIFVFTPKGDIHTLPVGSTPVDFAYSVHTEVGNRCIGAKVDGRLVPLERELTNGQIVEIFTSKAANAGPTRDWLSFVVSSRAKTKIRQYFAKERREEAIEVGKDAIAKAIRREGLPVQRLISQQAMSEAAHDLGYRDIALLYAAVGENHVAAKTVVDKVVSVLGGAEQAGEAIAERYAPATPPGVRAPRVRSACWSRVSTTSRSSWPDAAPRCRAIRSSASSPRAARSRCTGSTAPTPTHCGASRPRLVDVSWDPNSASVFLVAIQVEALDRHRLLSDITKTLADEKVNILSANLSMTKDRMAISRFSFEMADPKHLGHLLRAVRAVEGVYDVYRVTSA